MDNAEGVCIWQEVHQDHHRRDRILQRIRAIFFYTMMDVIIWRWCAGNYKWWWCADAHQWLAIRVAVVSCAAMVAGVRCNFVQIQYTGSLLVWQGVSKHECWSDLKKVGGRTTPCFSIFIFLCFFFFSVFFLFLCPFVNNKGVIIYCHDGNSRRQMILLRYVIQLWIWRSI